jgi:hypothetical protein
MSLGQAKKIDVHDTYHSEIVEIWNKGKTATVVQDDPVQYETEAGRVKYG